MHGCGTPTVSGVRAVLDSLGLGTFAIWSNLREEPMIYIGGKPFVVRDADRPAINVHKFGGKEPELLERSEAALKDDVLRELNFHEGKILLHSRRADGELSEHWHDVSLDGGHSE